MRIAIISGSSSGIGLETAKLFLRENYQVISLSRKKTDLDGIIDLQCDLSTQNPFQHISNDLTAMLVQAESIVLVHNACAIQKDQVDCCNIELLQKAFAVGVFLV